jgi:hypothetical protein
MVERDAPEVFDVDVDVSRRSVEFPALRPAYPALCSKKRHRMHDSTEVIRGEKV